ncbi:MAG: helix-turn-helix transcriptional regulator [Bacillota bacterium]|nr:helix-turn-helix transcriptional regulator [Bacillota bacterium]
MTFAEAVRRARLAKGLSQGKLARAIGVTPQYISDIERGRAFGSYRTVWRLAEVLELRMEEVFPEGP